MASPRRPALALNIASLPPLAMGSPVDEKAQLPCIMITPSSPTHEYDYEFFTFPQPEPRELGVLSIIRHAFTGSRHSYITLSDSPNPNYQPSTTGAWSVSKRFRAILLLGACLMFVMFHLCVLPKVDYGHGLYDVLMAHSDSQPSDDTAIATLWQVVPEMESLDVPAPEAATTGLAFDADEIIATMLL